MHLVRVNENMQCMPYDEPAYDGHMMAIWWAIWWASIKIIVSAQPFCPWDVYDVFSAFSSTPSNWLCWFSIDFNLCNLRTICTIFRCCRLTNSLNHLTQVIVNAKFLSPQFQPVSLGIILGHRCSVPRMLLFTHLSIPKYVIPQLLEVFDWHTS